MHVVEKCIDLINCEKAVPAPLYCCLAVCFWQQKSWERP